MIKINGNEIKDSVNNGDGVYLQFSATWCGPCKTLKRTVESIEADYKNVSFYYVDIDECDPEIIKAFGVRSVPVACFFKSGELTSQKIGSLSQSKIKDELAVLCM